MSRGPSLTPDQIQALNQAPVTPNVGPGATPIQQSTSLTPAQVATQTSGLGPGLQQPNIWDRLMSAVGQGGTLPKMPGTTVGAPAGASPAMAPQAAPPMMPQGQMPRPPGMGPYFQALQNPAAGAGNSGLMAQYMALQQLMRGS